MNTQTLIFLLVLLVSLQVATGQRTGSGVPPKAQATAIKFKVNELFFNVFNAILVRVEY